jgi:hypothetical protein
MDWSDCELEEQEFNFERRGSDCAGSDPDVASAEPAAALPESRALEVFTADFVAEVRRAKGAQTEALLKEISALAEAHAQGEVKDGETEQTRLQNKTKTRCTLPTTGEGWALLAGKDTLALCQELFGPADTAAFAEYLSEKAIQELLTEDVVRQDTNRRRVQTSTVNAQTRKVMSIREIWPAGMIDSRVLELWTGDRWAVLVVSNSSCVRNALTDIIASREGSGVGDPHVMIREGSCWCRVAVRTLDATNTSVIVLISAEANREFEVPSANRSADTGAMLQMAFDWDGRMFVGERVVRLKKLLVMQAVREEGVEVTRLSSRVFRLCCEDEVCYFDLDALGRGPYGWQVNSWTRVGNAQVSLFRGSLTHLALPCPCTQ